MYIVYATIQISYCDSAVSCMCCTALECGERPGGGGGGDCLAGSSGLDKTVSFRAGVCVCVCVCVFALWRRS